MLFYFEETCISNILLDDPLVASGEKPKAFFPLTEIMPFKFEYNLNIDNILVQNSNLVFQPI